MTALQFALRRSIDTNRFPLGGRSIFGAWRRSLAWAWILCCAAPSASALASQMFVDPQFGVSVTTNIQYASGLDGKGNNVPLQLDLYRPTGPGLPSELPAIVLMHGGYFYDGDKSSMSAIANAFAQRGYVAVSINYRKLGLLPPPPGAPLPLDPSRYPSWLIPQLNAWGVTVQQYANTIAAAVSDQGAAVNWLVSNAGTYDIHPEMIAAGGYSAGGVSSLLLGAGAIDGVNANVGAVLAIAGGMFGMETAIDSGDPAVYVIHGTLDTVVPYSEVGYLQTALAGAGVPYEARILPGVGHSIPSSALTTNPEPIFEFLITHLTPIPEPSTLALAALGGVGLLPAAWRSRARVRRQLGCAELERPMR